MTWREILGFLYLVWEVKGDRDVSELFFVWTVFWERCGIFLLVGLLGLFDVFIFLYLVEGDIGVYRGISSRIG